MDLVLTDNSEYEVAFDFRLDEIANSIKSKTSDIRETNILNKILRLTEGQIQFNDEMNIYSMDETAESG